MAGSPPGFTVARRWFDAFNRRDLAETLALAHPEIAFRPLQLHGGETWHGRDGIEALWGRMNELGLSHEVEITSLHELPGGIIAALGVVKPGDVPFVGTFRLEDGLVREARNRFSDEDTLRGLGLA
jgi:hypothetical protein